MSSRWSSYAWQTVPGGISSAVTPELLPTSQYAWGYNIAVRGGKAHTRPPFVERPCGNLPSGLLQGASYFGVQGGMIVCSIMGRLYRIRIGQNIFSWEPITLPWRNSAAQKQVWMQQTVETLVIQDGQSAAVLYNGSTAVRAVAGQVPIGRQMAYGNGRLWVAVGYKNLQAGDIRTNTPGSELAFTETDYLSGGGSLFFPRGMTGMQFIPITGAADFGTLMVFGYDYADSIRADVTSRDQWGMPGFVTTVFRDIGCAGAWSIAQVNQDLYWRDGHGEIRSLANGISTNNTPGSTPISREVSRLVNFDSDNLLPWVSSIYFDNRLLMTSSPYLNVSGGVSFRDLVSLDFAPISSMQAKAPPAYDGQWTGIPGISNLVTGQFNGVNRAFALSSDEEGVNRLWEIMPSGRADLSISCGSGIIAESPITSFIEYPSVNFGMEKARKRLQRADVWLSGINGDLDLKLYWRPDNTQKWTQWDDVSVCAKTSDATTSAPHTWKNLLPEQRPQIKSFTIPDDVDEVTKYALQQGFYFQLRVEWTGQARIEKVMLHAIYDDDPDYADREALTAECIENDVTGNNINYVIPTSTGYLDIGPFDDLTFAGVQGGPFTPDSDTYTLTNRSLEDVTWQLSISETWLTADVTSGTLAPGESVDVTLTLDADELTRFDSPYSATIAFVNLTNGCGDRVFTATLDVTGTFPGDTIAFQQYDGPFVYPVCMTEYNNRYYKTQEVSGDNIAKFAPTAGDPASRECALGGSPPAWGLVSTVWSGSATLDMDCVQTGAVAVSLNRQGALGAYDFPGVPGTTENLTDFTVDGLFEQLFDPAAPGRRASFMTELYQEYEDVLAARVYRRWSSPYPNDGGYFAGSYGGPYGSIWCPGHTVVAIYSDPVTIDDLAVPIARSGGIGSAAQTQTTGAFSPGSHTNEGNFSRALITVPVDVSHSTLYGTFTFAVTDGSGARTIIVNQAFTISSATVSGTVDYPQVENAVIVLTDWEYSYFRSYSETFDSYEDGGCVLSLVPSLSWNTVAIFDAPVSNTACWDDWEDYPSTVTTQITTNPHGVRWAAQETFNGADPVIAYDDFEGYTAATTVSIFAQGVGWSGPGGSAVADYTSGWDDFESYTAGTITVLDFAGFNNKWNGDGSFLAVDNESAWDDLESYGAGTITVFNYTSTDNLWDGDGRAVQPP